MTTTEVRPPYDRFLLTAEEVVRARPDSDPEIVREVFLEVATTLDNGLALDGLDEHDTEAAVDALCEELVDPDPGAAVRARAATILAEPGPLHDPQAVSGALLVAAAILRI
ncbi:MAG: hypothetical protein QM747_03450 [Nocardioides sp.]